MLLVRRARRVGVRPALETFRHHQRACQLVRDWRTAEVCPLEHAVSVAHGEGCGKPGRQANGVLRPTVMLLTTPGRRTSGLLN